VILAGIAPVRLMITVRAAAGTGSGFDAAEPPISERQEAATEAEAVTAP
jgi:hypothetical protein